MIDRGHDLSITKQAEVLKISRGSVYYLPRPVSSADLAIMRHLDRLHLEYPFAGSRMLRGLLALQGWACEDADAADGDRGALSPSAHHQARTRPQDLSVPAARHGDHAAEPGLGDGHHVHSNGAGLRLSRRSAAEAPLIDAENLFRFPGPALCCQLRVYSEMLTRPKPMALQ
jgi:hypothetical protein